MERHPYFEKQFPQIVCGVNGCNFTDTHAWVEYHKQSAHPAPMPGANGRTPYCTGCEGAEIEEVMAEVLFEGASRAEALRHAHQYFFPFLCDNCKEYNAEWEEREAEEDPYDAHYRALQEEFEAEHQRKLDQGYIYHSMTNTWIPPF